MAPLILVALGGSIGAAARYLISSALLQKTLQHSFPYATFLVNITGCLLAGAVLGLFEKHYLLNANVRLFLITGILGGFTTFSAFGIETLLLIRKGNVATAAAYVLLSVLCGCLALWLAFSLVPQKNG